MVSLLRLNNKKICSLFTIGILCCITVHAQIKLSAKYFEGTTWAVSNKDSSFYKSDTIRIVKLSDKSSPKTDDSKNVAGYFSDNDFITMEFKKAKGLILFTTKVDSWSIVKKKGKYVWMFLFKSQTLKLYFNNKLFAIFKPLSKSQVQIKSEYTDGPLTATAEIVMKRIL